MKKALLIAMSILLVTLTSCGSKESVPPYCGLYNLEWSEVDGDDYFSSVGTVKIEPGIIKWSNEIKDCELYEESSTIITCDFEDPSTYHTVEYVLVPLDEFYSPNIFAIVKKEDFQDEYPNYLFFVDENNELSPAQEFVLNRIDGGTPESSGPKKLTSIFFEVVVAILSILILIWVIRMIIRNWSKIMAKVKDASQNAKNKMSGTSEQISTKASAPQRSKRIKLILIIVSALAVIGASVGIYAHFTSKNERKIKDTLDSLSAAGIHLTRDVYSLDDLHNIIRRINDGGDGTLSKDEFSLLSDKLQRKMIESGDVAQFYELKDMASNAISKSNNHSSSTSSKNKIKTENVNFKTPLDVWSYLSRNTFFSDNGLRVQIRRDGVYVNGSPQYATPEIVQFNSKSAVIKAFTPYGHSSTTFVISPEVGYMQTLSGEELWSR